MATPLLGFIRQQDRSPVQQLAHAQAIASFPRFALSGPNWTPNAGVKIILPKAFEAPEVIADIGMVFNGFRQLTGSCVGVSEGNGIATTGAVQRLIADNPTKAFIPWWPFPYGRTRFNEGDVGPGEGAIDSVMGQTLVKEGCFAITEAPGLPTFNTSDGLAITAKQELQYSDGASQVNTKYMSLAKQHPLGGIGVCNSTQDVWDAITNGYFVLDGCDNYIGNGSIQNGVCIGQYDGQGGHSTGYCGVWDHSVLGRLFLYWNQWAGDTYPEDGSGKPRCSVWVKENIVARLFQTGGGGGETMALSHLTYFPAQPKMQDWESILPIAH